MRPILLAPLALSLTLFATLIVAQEPTGTGDVNEDANSVPADAVSIFDGVFTEEQAERGRALYGDYCTACHGGNLRGTWNMGPSIAGFRFERDWVGSTVGELFAYLKEEMPKDDPGILIDSEYVDVIAYILFRNEYPFGTTMELPLDPDEQALITISAH